MGIDNLTVNITKSKTPKMGNITQKGVDEPIFFLNNNYTATECE